MGNEARTISVVGAGQKGAGIAHVFAQAKCDVYLFDVSGTAVQQAAAK